MNKEEIDKWLDNEYGCSYTRLEELHDFLIDRNMKYQDEIERYKNIVDDVYEFVEWHYKDNQEYYKNKGIGLNYPECDYILNKLKELRGFENE